MSNGDKDICLCEAGYGKNQPVSPESGGDSDACFLTQENSPIQETPVDCTYCGGHWDHHTDSVGHRCLTDADKAREFLRSMGWTAMIRDDVIGCMIAFLHDQMPVAGRNVPESDVSRILGHVHYRDRIRTSSTVTATKPNLYGPLEREFGKVRKMVEDAIPAHHRTGPAGVVYAAMVAAMDEVLAARKNQPLDAEIGEDLEVTK